MLSKIIAIINQKGGVGKSTIAVTLSFGLISWRKRVRILFFSIIFKYYKVSYIYPYSTILTPTLSANLRITCE
ncbi:ParA family protein [Rickettsia endosymbiont of Ixodes scapularis]|uniref:ParA family protein n=1 Tax=Rickettsia endosymbiont of Ixodes scapularis TaxID=444612 RepID=UPI001F51CDCE|nr:AAA family ATPase [Rickettsia endosymbiont of Ixodes scapularis]